MHHLELWVPDLDRAIGSLGWLLQQLGYVQYQDWARGRSWRLGGTYVVVEQSTALTSEVHDRCRPGLNHLAFHAGTSAEVEALVSDARNHGWTLMFPQRHPHAGGPDHYAAYLENSDGFEVELVATLRELG
jgi:catechol 2,3-dioxygenase-like lactoylglutathione lyase family enzyme